LFLPLSRKFFPTFPSIKAILNPFLN
jgi:hypothetical protein